MLTREALAKTVRSALVENWKDQTLGGKWDEDILLTGCKAAKYANPEEAANNLALFVADAVLALLPASPPADVEGVRSVFDDLVAVASQFSVAEYRLQGRCPPILEVSVRTKDCEALNRVLERARAVQATPEPKTDAAVKALVENKS